MMETASTFFLLLVVGFVLLAALAFLWVVSAFCLRKQKEDAMWRDSRRVHLAIQHQLKEGFTPAEVSRNLHVPLVIVQHEEELM